MSSEEKVMALLAEGNPATELDSDAWSGIDAATYLATLERRSSGVQPVDKPRSLRAALIGFAVVLVTVGVVLNLRPDERTGLAALPTATRQPEGASEIADIAFVQSTYSWDGYRDGYGAEVPLVDRPRVFSVSSAGGDPTLLAEVPGWDDIPLRAEWGIPGPAVEWSPDGSRIAFGVNGAEAGIYVMNRDGSGLTRLTDLADFASDVVVPSLSGLAWSPDGSRLAFMSPLSSMSPGVTSNGPFPGHSHPPHALFLVDTRDGNPTMVAESNADGIPTPPIVWSPDGTLLAFARTVGPLRNATHGLHVINADGTQERRLVEMHRADLWGFGWSPDGSRIGFMRSDGAGPGEVSSRDDLGGLWVIEADGSGLRTVSERGAGFTEILVVHPQGRLDWSPDGNLIAVPAGDDAGIVLVSADGSGERVMGAGVVIDHYSFSPDWSQIVFSDFGGIASEDPPTWDPPSIYVMNTDGTGLRWLADGEYPDWSN